MFFSVITVLIAMISIQSGASLAKQMFSAVGPAGATSLRLVFAALILCVISRPWRQRLAWNQLKFVLLFGASLGGMNLAFYLALERIPLGITVAIEFMGPLAVAVISSRKALDFVWAALAVAGIVLILPITEASGSLDPLGILFAALAGLGWALYIVFGQRLGAKIQGGSATALGMLAAAIFVLPFGVAQAGTALFEPAILPIAIGVAALSSALPYSLEMRALQKMPARTFSILMSVEPAIAAVSGLLMLGERLSLTQWVAVFCAMIASLGSALGARQRNSSAT